jgi:dTDP-4-amino-4,6-dideoxygalactose transaminase
MERRMELRRTLHALGFQTERPYPALGSREAFPNAHDLAARLVLLPCHASLTPALLGRLARALERALADAARDERLAS